MYSLLHKLFDKIITGEYVIDVFYYGKPIQGSPFRVNAFDWNRITVHNLKSSGIVGKLVEFDSKFLWR